MKAFELLTKITDEGGLEIPASFLERLPHNQPVRVLILIEEQEHLIPKNVSLDSNYMEQPQITDPVEREKILNLVAESMECHPLSPEAPKLSREDLHER